jgi:hypothetical protein
MDTNVIIDEIAERHRKPTQVEVTLKLATAGDHAESEHKGRPGLARAPFLLSGELRRCHGTDGLDTTAANRAKKSENFPTVREIARRTPVEAIPPYEQNEQQCGRLSPLPPARCFLRRGISVIRFRG